MRGRRFLDIRRIFVAGFLMSWEDDSRTFQAPSSKVRERRYLDIRRTFAVECLFASHRNVLRMSAGTFCGTFWVCPRKVFAHWVTNLIQKTEFPLHFFRSHSNKETKAHFPILLNLTVISTFVISKCLSYLKNSRFLKRLKRYDFHVCHRP